MEWLKGFGVLFGRILVVLIFLQSGVGKIEDFQGTAKYMASHGIAPYTNFFVVGSIFFELVGVITLVLGYYARFGAFLLLLFLIPTTIILHTNFSEQGQMIHFMKNLSMFGGLLVLLAVGAGRFSLDYFFRSGRK